ncbi:MAG: hypothetical protein QM713_17040 [Arachnia sp.]
MLKMLWIGPVSVLLLIRTQFRDEARARRQATYGRDVWDGELTDASSGHRER